MIHWKHWDTLLAMGIGALVGWYRRTVWENIPLGTRSVLLGAHCFFLHPWFVAAGWCKLYGFPFDPRLWIAFIVHDWGYWGKEAMDDERGELHPWLGAQIMHHLFDRKDDTTWRDFCLCHSRYLAKRYGEKPSKLCFADKLAFALTPAWLYLPMVQATGELAGYMSEQDHADQHTDDPRIWHECVADYMNRYVDQHVGGLEDRWTKERS